MSTELSTYQETIVMEGDTPPAEPERVPVPREGEIEILRVVGNPHMRLNVESGERRRLRSGETICWDEGLVYQILLDDDGGGRAVVEYEVRQGFTVRGFGGSEHRSSVPGPLRLQGDLAPGTTLASGEDASEAVDVSGAVEARVRALTSGQTTFSLAGTAAQGARPVEVDDDLELAFGAEEFGATVAAYDISDPSNPSRVDTVDPFSVQADISHLVGLGIDEANQVLLVVVYDNTNNVLETVRVSYDASGTLTLEDHQDIAGMPLPSREEAGAAVALPSLGTSAAWVVAAGTGGFPGDGVLAILDYDYAAPSVTVTIRDDTVHHQGLSVDRDRALVAANNGDDGDPTIYSVPDATTLQARSRLDLEGTGSATGALQRHSGLDPDAEIMVAVLRSPDRVAVLDYSDPDNLTLLATYEEIGGVNVANTKALDALGRDGLWTFGNFGGDVDVVNLSNPSAAGHVARESPGNEAWPRFFDGPSDLWVATGDGDRDFHMLRFVGSSDVLVFYPLLSNGDRAATGVVTVPLPDGAEAMLTADIVGPDEVEIEVRARSEAQTTVDYVELAQE
jgi:hypothetical protein